MDYNLLPPGTMNDDKVTLHQLSHDLDFPERRVRHKFLRLVAAGELKQGEDFIRDNYQSQFNFQYLIDPMKFIRAAKLERRAEEVLSLRSLGNQAGSELANERQPSGNHDVSKRQQHGNHSASEPLPSGSDSGTENPAPGSENGKGEIVEILRSQVGSQKEMIDFQKEQLNTKDEQIKAYREYLTEQGEFDRKMYQQLVAAKEELRRLGPGAQEQPDDTVPDEPEEDSDVISVGPPGETVEREPDRPDFKSPDHELQPRPGNPANHGEQT